MSYVDLNTIHNPATGTVAPATWGDQIRENDEFLIDPPACSVTHSANQSVPDNTNTALSADSENYDNDAMHSTVTNNSRITVQTAGRYQFSTTVRTGTNQTGFRQVQFRKNGTTTFNVGRHDAAGAGDTVISGTRNIIMSVGDYVEVMMLHTMGVSGTINFEEFAALFMTR